MGAGTRAVLIAGIAGMASGGSDFGVPAARGPGAGTGGTAPLESLFSMKDASAAR